MAMPCVGTLLSVVMICRAFLPESALGDLSVGRQVPTNYSCEPAGNAQLIDDHCHCMRWPLTTLNAVCNGYNGAANGGGVTVDGRFYPDCEV
jgi:hypothetical protein